MRKSKTHARTLQEFADACQSKLTTVSGWIRKDWWRWDKRAPWPLAIVPDVLNAAADAYEATGRRVGRPTKEQSDPVGTETTKGLRDEKLRQEIRKLRANADQAVTALAKERGALHDADVCEDERTRAASVIRNAFQNVAPQAVVVALSAGMPHAAAPEFHKKIDELVNGCLRYLATSPDAEPETSDDPSAAIVGAA